MNNRIGRKQTFCVKQEISQQRQESTNHSLHVGKKSKYPECTKSPGKCEFYYRLLWQRRQNKELRGL